MVLKYLNILYWVCFWLLTILSSSLESRKMFECEWVCTNTQPGWWSSYIDLKASRLYGCSAVKSLLKPFGGYKPSMCLQQQQQQRYCQLCDANGTALVGICWQHLVLPWRFCQKAWLFACLFTHKTLSVDLFSKLPQPCVLICVWQTKIKSPRCELHLHPWHLDIHLCVFIFFPRALHCSHLSEPYCWCQAWDFYSKTFLQRQRGSLGKR